MVVILYAVIVRIQIKSRKRASYADYYLSVYSPGLSKKRDKVLVDS